MKNCKTIFGMISNVQRFFFFFIVENKLFILIIEEILNERMAEKLEKSKINMLQTLGETIFDYTRVISRENNVYGFLEINKLFLLTFR